MPEASVSISIGQEEGLTSRVLLTTGTPEPVTVRAWTLTFCGEREVGPSLAHRGLAPQAHTPPSNKGRRGHLNVAVDVLRRGCRWRIHAHISVERAVGGDPAQNIGQLASGGALSISRTSANGPPCSRIRDRTSGCSVEDTDTQDGEQKKSHLHGLEKSVHGCCSSQSRRQSLAVGFNWW